MTEFEFINTQLKSQAYARDDVVLGIGDDAAIVTPPEAQLIMTMDTLNDGIHFDDELPPEAIAHKALAVNLSDIAAMGGTPLWACFSLSLPHLDPAWFTPFFQSLHHQLARHQVSLIGGDTCRGPLSITIQLTGRVAPGKALCRSGACPGDEIYVTGFLGAAACALHLSKHSALWKPEAQAVLRQALHYPEPQLMAGQILAGIASAAIDISDGLSADLGHILTASDVGARVYGDVLPVHPLLAQALTPEQWLPYVLSGGEDYQLCFTLAPEQRSSLPADFLSQCHLIGQIESTPGFRLLDAAGHSMLYTESGYQHF